MRFRSCDPRLLIAALVCGGLALALLALTGCARPTSPSAPVAASIAIGGQSNSLGLRPFLAALVPVVGYGEVAPIAPCWDATGPCWSALRPQLHARIRAAVWSQGESDILAQAGGARYSYRPAFASLMARIRAEAGNPSLLIVVMEKGPWAAYWETQGISVDAEIRAWIAQDGNAVLVPTRDLAWREDGIHMTDAGYAAAAARVLAVVEARAR